jgi:hypothetical protein
MEVKWVLKASAECWHLSLAGQLLIVPRMTEKNAMHSHIIISPAGCMTIKITFVEEEIAGNVKFTTASAIAAA